MSEYRSEDNYSPTLCAVCGRVENPAGLCATCEDCRDKAAGFNGFLEDSMVGHEDTTRLCYFEEHRTDVLAMIIRHAQWSVRECIDFCIETAKERGELH